MRRHLIVFLLVLLSPTAVFAVKVPGLYQAEVPVPDQTDQSRLKGINQALEMVLVKLTGDRYVSGRTDLAPILQRAENYVQQFRYRRDSGVASEEEPEVIPDLLLTVRFEEEALDQSLRELSVSIWGRERPSTLLWLVMQSDKDREMISLDNGEEYIFAIDNRAGQRGIAILYPLMDLEDNARLRPTDIWGNFQQPVLEASKRYGADSILTASIESPAPGIWEGRWTAYIDNRVYQWRTEADLVDAVLDEGIDGMADLLAAHFARPGDPEVSEVRIAVADIFTVDQYAAVLKYFESLNSVTWVQVERVESGQVIFLLRAHGGGLAVSQAIALGQLLEPISGSQGMAYRLLP